MVTVSLSSEVSVNGKSMLLAVPVLHHALPCRDALTSPVAITCLLWPGCTCPACPCLCSQESPQVVQKSLSSYAPNPRTPLSWNTFIHWLGFFFLKIYHTATGKGGWPLQAFFSQAALSPLLTLRGLSQKGAWLEGVPSWTPAFSQVLVEKPAPAWVQWILAGIPNWNSPRFYKWQKVGRELAKYLCLACPHIYHVSLTPSMGETECHTNKTHHGADKTSTHTQTCVQTTLSLVPWTYMVGGDQLLVKWQVSSHHWQRKLAWAQSTFIFHL